MRPEKSKESLTTLYRTHIEAGLDGPLTRYLPIYEFSSRTNFLKDAEIDLRILHDGKPATGTRVLGRTVRLEDNEWIPVPGVKVEIYSPSTGQFEAISDSRAVFDVSGLPNKSFSIRAAGNVWESYECCKYARSEPGLGHVCDCPVHLH